MSMVAAGALALLGGALGWWPLAVWAERVMRAAPGERMRPRTARVILAASTALSFALVGWRQPPWPVLAVLLVYCAIAAVLAVVDVAEHRLPNSVIAVGVIVLALLLIIASAITGEWARLLWAAGGATALFAVYFLLAMITPAAMGMGDVKLAFLIGLLLGWFGLSVWLLGLVAGFIVGGLAALGALALRKVTLTGSLPFGPSMLLGALVAILVLPS